MIKDFQNLDDESYEQFIGFYAISAVGLIFSLLFPVLELLYALYYFGVMAYFLFSTEQSPPDPQRSSRVHYDRYSRWNWFNYALGAFIAISAFVYLFSPISKPLTIFLIWSGATYFLYKNRQKLSEKLGSDFMISYLTEQFPSLTQAQIVKANSLLMADPNLPVATLAAELEIDTNAARELHYMFNVYLSNLE